MFDISWVELLFVGMLALVIIGPKDLPQVFKAVAKFVAKGKRMLNDVKGSMAQLEKEVNIDAGKVINENDWRELLPEEIRNLPDDFIPGSMTAEQHLERRAQVNQAKKNASSSKLTANDKAAIETNTETHTSSRVESENEQVCVMPEAGKKHG